MDRRVTVPDLRAAKGRRRLTCLTAYDAPTARIVDGAGIDMVLVGDSAGTVVQGGADTLRVTLDQMLYHTRCVAGATARALVIGDMPFGSYQESDEAAVRAATAFLAAGAAAVKLEGGARAADRARAIARWDIPVMGHVGLTPQSVHALGGYRVQRDADRLSADAQALVEAGVFAVVLEAVPPSVAARITREIPVPTIGIGAGRDCDGQVLVLHDMLGLSGEFRPRFVKRYADLGAAAREAAAAFKREVEAGAFPGAEHCYEEQKG